MFIKFSAILVFSIFFLFLLFMNFSYNFAVNFSFLSFLPLILTFDFVLSLSLSTLCFLTMVILVVFYVCVFSSIYLESYNIKKYFLLFLLFFFSMIFLILSSSPLILITSWDYLGISSIFLVMFYPSFVTFSNSVFTMMFNRLGDLMLITGVCFLFFFFEKFYYYYMNLTFMIFMFFCALTKSAQFPFSTWLPLAMSAPTPISAMVHSSTLVTAGILIFTKFYHYFFFLNFYLVCIFSALTFFCGGLMACCEMDLKKIVAYSTMSQISMIVFFFSFSLEMIGLIHMMFHAFFKSFLFSCCGITFMSFFMTQNFIMISNIFSNYLIKFGFFLSIFSMTGLIFSLSFFSKDFILEWFFNIFICHYFFFIMVTFSLFTLVYSGILFEVCKIKFIYSNNFFLKNFNFSFLPFLIYGVSYMFCDFLPMFYSFLNIFDFFFFLIIFFSFCFFTIKMMNYFNLFYVYNFFSQAFFEFFKRLFKLTKLNVLGDLLFFFPNLMFSPAKLFFSFFFFYIFSLFFF